MYSITDEPAHVQVFVPFEQPPTYARARRPASMAVLLRVSGSAESAVSTVRQIVTGIDPLIPVFGVQPLRDLINQANETPRLGTALIGSISLLALILALVGVYGVLSYTVSQRTREIGVRVALGAGRGEIVRLIASQAGVLVGLGLALGAGAALASTRWLKTMLVDVSPTDPVVFASVAALLAITAGLAALIPARRAARVDPVTALRGD
jgi:putative ABC transport system permease protein